MKMSNKTEEIWKDLAKKFNVGYKHIIDIAKGKRWKHLSNN
jgi:hypothetical protein